MDTPEPMPEEPEEGDDEGAGASMGFGREDGRRRDAFAPRDDAEPDTAAVPEMKVGPVDADGRVSTEGAEAGGTGAAGVALDAVDGRAAFGAAAPPITRVFMLVSFLRGSGPVVRAGSTFAPSLGNRAPEVAFAPEDVEPALLPRFGSVSSAPARDVEPCAV